MNKMLIILFETKYNRACLNIFQQEREFKYISDLYIDSKTTVDSLFYQIFDKRYLPLQDANFEKILVNGFRNYCLLINKQNTTTIKA